MTPGPLTHSSPTWPCCTGWFCLVHDLHLPAVAGDADGPHLVDVVHAQVDAARAGGLGQAVVGVVLVVGEVAHPVLDEGGGHRLGADVHQPPLGQLVVLQLQVTPVQGGQNVLAPGHQQPHDGAALLGDGVEDGLGGVALEQDGLAAGEQGAEPVHLGAGVVQGRDAQEHVLVGGLVVDGLHPGGLEQGLVLEQNGLGEAGGAGGVVDGGLVLVVDEHLGGHAGAVGGGPVVVLGKGGAGLPHEEEQQLPGQVGRDVLHPADELRAEEQHIHVGQLQAVVDLLGGVAEVQRARRRPRPSECRSRWAATPGSSSAGWPPSGPCWMPRPRSMLATRLAFSSKTDQVISRR